jgi:hypothetical protein
MAKINSRIQCPICSGKGKIAAPRYGMTRIQRKRTARRLRKAGLTIREIQRLMGIKSPQTVHALLKG